MGSSEELARWLLAQHKFMRSISYDQQIRGVGLPMLELERMDSAIAVSAAVGVTVAVVVAVTATAASVVRVTAAATIKVRREVWLSLEKIEQPLIV